MPQTPQPYNFLTDPNLDLDGGHITFVDKNPTGGMRFFTLWKRDVNVFKPDNPAKRNKAEEDYRVRLLPVVSPQGGFGLRFKFIRNFGAEFGDDGKPRYGSEVIATHRAPFSGSEFFVNGKKVGDSSDIRKFVGLDYDDNPVELALRHPDFPQDRRDEIKFGEKVAVLLIDRLNEEAGPQWWTMPKAMAEALENLASDPEMGVENIFNHDIKFQVISSGKKPMNMRYATPTIVPKPSPLHKDKATAKRWLQFAKDNPLLAQLFFPTRAQLCDKIQRAYNVSLDDAPVKPKVSPQADPQAVIAGQAKGETGKLDASW